MDLGIGKAINSGNGNTIIYTALLAACAANFLPTVADSIYFRRVNEMERKFDAGEISAEKLEYHVAMEYYLWTAGYYALLFLGIYAIGGEYKNNARILLAIVAGGLVIGAVQKNIEIDKAVAEKKALQNSTVSH